MSVEYDILIIGGGINGCGIARDAAGRGYSVYLCEADDLASGTSSQSTKLIHGGLRYLEHYEFRLVRESLTEREILWQIAPHIIHPLRFVLPHHKTLRPAWLLRLGLFLYDHIGGRKKLPATKVLNLQIDEAGKNLRHDYKKGFEYSDCAVDDARLVILNALDAHELGASINTLTKCVSLKRNDKHWKVTLKNQETQALTNVTAKLVINASGPWVDTVLNQLYPEKNNQNIRLVQGSHIIVPKLYQHEKCYIFQNEDNRIIFAIPYQLDFTLIGTTDHEYQGDPSKTHITQDEIDYLCSSVNHYFIKEISSTDIVGTFSGVRSLVNDNSSKAQEATRDYVLNRDKPDEDSATLINIFGGKITTFRRLAESVMKEVESHIGKRKKGAWTEKSHLPGGDFAAQDYGTVIKGLHNEYPFLTHNEITHFIKCYGTRTNQILNDIRSTKDLGTHFGHGLYQKEVEYLIHTEWALTADDILWRRTKLGLYFTQKEKEELEIWIKKALLNKQLKGTIHEEGHS